MSYWLSESFKTNTHWQGARRGLPTVPELYTTGLMRGDDFIPGAPMMRFHDTIVPPVIGDTTSHYGTYPPYRGTSPASLDDMTLYQGGKVTYTDDTGTYTCVMGAFQLHPPEELVTMPLPGEPDGAAFNFNNVIFGGITYDFARPKQSITAPCVVPTVERVVIVYGYAQAGHEDLLPGYLQDLPAVTYALASPLNLSYASLRNTLNFTHESWYRETTIPRGATPAPYTYDGVGVAGAPGIGGFLMANQAYHHTWSNFYRTYTSTPGTTPGGTELDIEIRPALMVTSHRRTGAEGYRSPYIGSGFYNFSGWQYDRGICEGDGVTINYITSEGSRVGGVVYGTLNLIRSLKIKDTKIIERGN